MSFEESNIKHYYLHADLDAFFASVEQLDHPEYRGKPLIVGGKPEDKRSVVSTASYEARAFGVHSAMPTAKAYQLCPQGIFVHGRMKRYSELSYQIMQIFNDFSPDVQQMSIDEAFIDLTGTEKLFGPPEETAYKIKERVKKETGLTVSIGLAPTKYLAKLASDMNKPDGFYMIKEGTEENFMLNLPLKKVWGIGDKTYDALKMAGLKTTRDIHEKSLEALTFMYGQNTGNFLYNVVRGIECVSFERQTKSHSISNETTFPFDLTNTYTAETAMLELCHSVIFRLLKEKGFSRTVQVKIRYEDFSTVSIQQTYPQSILTLDSLYSVAKELFEKKYEKGRGIRLLGIALENIENTEQSWQPGLFDDNNEKKQNVEKAILNLEKKHPEIKIHKARILQNLNRGSKILITTLLLALSGIFTGRLPLAYAQEETEADKNYEISGSWTGQMKGSIDSTFGMGNKFGFSAKAPVFTTDVDLSALVHITPFFYFELEFLDKFYNNTYTLAYNGPGYLNLFKFSNRNITFPAEYSSSLNFYGISGGKNQAPGIMLHFEDFDNHKWKGDFLLRYDMTQQKTALFYGNNSVQDNESNLYDYVKSKSFVIPSQALFHIQDIYIQTEAGSYKSQEGISFYKLSPQDYLIDSQNYLLLLSDSIYNLITAKSLPQILITFDDDLYCQTLLQDTGSYTDSLSFAGQIQSYFSISAPDLDLSLYSDLSYEAMTNTINGKKAFIIQSSRFFSPYLCANQYSLSKNQASEYLIKNKNSQAKENSYSIHLQNDFYNLSNDFFDENINYVLVENLNYINEFSFSGLPAASGAMLSPARRFPFADKYPLLYLDEKVELELVFVERNISPVKAFDIGKKAAAGSVKVYKNGVLLPAALYDSNTGFVDLKESVGELDKIYIVYEEESSSGENGFAATGAGFSYRILPSLTFDTSFTGKYQTGKSLNELSQNSFSALTNGLKFETKYFSAYDALSTAVETQKESDNNFVTKNTAGLSLHNKDGQLEAESSQAIAVNTKNGKKSSAVLNSNIKGNYTLWGITGGAYVAFNSLKLQSAGHSIICQKPLFNIFDFGEIYRFSKNELDKKNYIKLSIDNSPGFLISASTRAFDSEQTNKQNYSAQASVSFRIGDSLQTGSISFNANQEKLLAVTNQTDKTVLSQNTNYFSGWADISQKEFSSGRESPEHDISLISQYKSSYKFLKLSPEISFELSGKNQKKDQEAFLTQSTFKLSLPFSTKTNAFAFNFSQKTRLAKENQKSINYLQDINKTFSNQKDLQFFYKAIPFYSLFDSHYIKALDKNFISLAGSLEYDFTWRRKLFNDLKDFFIPLSASAAIARDYINTLGSVTDTYQLKGKLSSDFINLFGSSSSINIFDWYEQDEYTGFISGLYKFSPKAKKSPNFQISSGQLLTLFIKDSDTLIFSNDFYFDNYKNWTFKNTAAWSRSTKASLLLELTHLCWKKSLNLNLIPKVKDSISISLSTQNKTHKEIYSYQRSSEINFLTHFNLTSAAGISFGYEQKKTFRLGLNYELGLKLLF